MNDSVGENADSSSASDGDEVLLLEVPSLVHSNYKFDFLAFKEWHQINGCRFAPVDNSKEREFVNSDALPWSTTNNKEERYCKFLFYHDRVFGDRSRCEEGAVPMDANHIALMYVSWLRRQSGGQEARQSWALTVRDSTNNITS